MNSKKSELHIFPAGSLTKKIKRKTELYACPLCDDDIGPGYTNEELREHFKEDHLDQEGVNDFIKEVEETFTLIMTYIRALKERPLR